VTLLIRDDDVQKLLPMQDCITAMEEAFKEFNAGRADNVPRIRLETPTAPGLCYFVNTHIGAIPKFGTACIRIANLVRPVRTAGADRVRSVALEGKAEPATYESHDWGMVLLFSLQTGEPLAIMNGFSLSGIRVAATTAVAAKYLARQGAETLGILGTGKMARRHVEALAMVLPIKKVRAYSPSEDHRREFVQEMAALHLDVQAVPEARLAVEGTDIVCCTTNSLKPIVFGKWLRPGQLVTTIVNTDVIGMKTEADEETFTRSDLIVINDKTSVFSNKQTELLDPIERGLFGWEKVCELGKIVAGETAGRRHADELIYYKNNTGMAIQFAAAGHAIYQAALKQKGLCRELPTEWFGTDLTEWHKKGYRPSN